MEIEVVNHYKQTNMKLLLARIFERLPHFHHDIEILMPIEGSLYMETESQKHLIKKDEFFLISQDEIHAGFQTNEPNLFAVLAVSPDFCKSFYPRLANICITENHVTPTSNPKLYQCLRNAIRQTALGCKDESEGNELIIMAGLCKLVHGIMKYAKYVERSEQDAQAKYRENSRIASIVKYIHNNYAQNISLNTLADRLNMNPSYLSRYISTHLGMSFRDYVNNLRLEKAVNLLTTTDMSKLDVCIATGFSDYRYLNNSIQRLYNCTPDELKNNALYNEKLSNKREPASKQHDIVDVAIAHKTLVEYFAQDKKEQVK